MSGSSTIPGNVYHDNASATTDYDKANLFNDFLGSVYKYGSDSVNFDQSVTPNILLEDVNFTVDDVEKH